VARGRVGRNYEAHGWTQKHSAEDVVRKLRPADEFAAAGKTNEEIAAELEVSAATLYNWRRRTYGGMELSAAREIEACSLASVPEGNPA
jgi:transposase